MSDEIRDTLREELGAMRGAAEVAPEAAGGDVGASGQDSTGNVASPGPDEGASTKPVETGSADGTQAGRVRGPDGKFVAKPKTEATPSPKQGKESQVPPPVQGEPSQVKPPQPGEPSATPPPKFKAPNSWKPALREKWGSVTEDIQAEIDRREKEISAELSKTAEPRKFYEAVQQTIAPYQSMLAAEGLHPVRAIGELFQVAAGLRANNPQRVAGLVAGIVKQFGVDRFGPQFIEALAASIDGTGQPQGGAQSQAVDPNQLAQQIEQRVMAQFHQRQSQAMNQQVNQEVQSFAEGREFFEDVRTEMSALISSGVAKDLDDAYNRAVWANPDTRAALMQREEKKRAETANAAIQQSKAAASPIKSQPSSMNGFSNSDGSIRDTLREALAEARRR